MKSLEEIGVHDVAGMFPLLHSKSEAYQSLRASIDRNGLFQPIVLDSEGRILDGRNRYRVCVDLQIEPRFQDFEDLDLRNAEGKAVPEDEYAFSQNIARRDLTADQRTIIYANYGEWLDSRKRGGQRGNSNAAKTNATKPSHSTSPAKKRSPYTRKKVAEKAGVSEHKAQQALTVVHADPELAQKVAAGEVTLREASAQVAETNPAPTPTKKLPTQKPVAARVDEALRAVANVAAKVEPSAKPEFFNALQARLIELQ